MIEKEFKITTQNNQKYLVDKVDICKQKICCKTIFSPKKIIIGQFIKNKIDNETKIIKIRLTNKMIINYNLIIFGLMIVFMFSIFILSQLFTNDLLIIIISLCLMFTVSKVVGKINRLNNINNLQIKIKEN